MSRSTRATYWSTSPGNEPVALRCSDDVAEAVAGLHDLGRQAVHLDVALVADHELLRGVEQQQALGHVVDGTVEALLLQRQPLPGHAVLRQQLAHDRDQHAGDRERRGAGDGNQDADLLAPVGKRRSARGRRHHQDREVRQGTRRDQPVLAVDRAHEASGEVIERENLLLLERAVPEIVSHHLAGMREAGKQGAVPMQHRDRGTFAEHDGPEELLEIGRLDAAPDNAHEFAVRSHDLAHDQDGPGAGDAAVHRFDQHVRRLRIVSEGAEIGAIGNVDLRGRPCRRGVDHIAVGVDDVDTAHIRQRLDLRTQHLVHVLAGEAPAIILCGRDSGRAHMADEILLDDREILQLLIEMMGEQQHGVFQLTAGVA